MVRKVRHQPVRTYGKPGAGRPQRDDRKLMHVAGLDAVQALFKAAPERIERLFFEDSMKGHVGEMCLTLAKAHKTYRVVRGDEMDKVAGTAMHGGIVAMAEPRPVLEFDTALAAEWAKEGEGLLILDGVGNPHNLGAIVRTAAFFGLTRIVISGHKEQAAPSDAAYRVARGGLEHVTVYRAERLAEALKRLKKDYLVVGAALERGKPVEAYWEAAKPIALVLGNEEEGLPRDTIAQCDGIVMLEGGGAVQSLNVAATAAILIHELLA